MRSIGKLWRGDGARAFNPGRSLRKLVALLFVLLGAKLVSSTVDTTPMLGSPQLDYPGFGLDQPFWPQFAILWVIFGLGGGLLAALGMLAWSDEPVETPTLPRAALVAAASLVLIGGFQLVGFLTFGTMGPLHVRQPIFRFALVNGAVSSVVVTAAWSLACLVVGRLSPRLGKVKIVAVSLATTLVAATGVVLIIAMATGMPPASTLRWWWSGLVFLALAVGLLVSLALRSPQDRDPPYRSHGGA